MNRLAEYLAARFKEQIKSLEETRIAKPFAGTICPVCKNNRLSGTVIYQSTEIRVEHTRTSVFEPDSCEITSDQYRVLVDGGPADNKSEFSRLNALLLLVKLHTKPHMCPGEQVLLKPHCTTLQLLSAEFSDRDDYDTLWSLR